MLRTVANSAGRRMMVVIRHRIRGRDRIDEDGSDRGPQQHRRMGQAETAIVDFGCRRDGTVRSIVCVGLTDRAPESSRGLRPPRAQHHRMRQRLQHRRSKGKQRRHQRKRAQLRRRLLSGHRRKYVRHAWESQRLIWTRMPHRHSGPLSTHLSGDAPAQGPIGETATWSSREVPRNRMARSADRRRSRPAVRCDSVATGTRGVAPASPSVVPMPDRSASSLPAA